MCSPVIVNTTGTSYVICKFLRTVMVLGEVYIILDTSLIVPEGILSVMPRGKIRRLVQS